MLISVSAIAQQKEITGIVFDRETKVRIAKVNVANTTTGQSVYNNFKGEFTIKATSGDVLVFSKPDHFSDTVKVSGNQDIAVYMKATAIQLKEVTIRDSALNPQRKLLYTKTQYSKIYGSLGNRDLLSMAPGAGVGFSIDALYNMFSKSGRNAAHLQEIIDRDYRQSVIDFRFNKTYVSGITQLKDPQLTDFMQKYRPGYTQVTTASEYEFVQYIRKSYKRYKRNPKAFELPDLPSITMSVQ